MLISFLFPCQPINTRGRVLRSALVIHSWSALSRSCQPGHCRDLDKTRHWSSTRVPTGQKVSLDPTVHTHTAARSFQPGHDQSHIIFSGLLGSPDDPRAQRTTQSLGPHRADGRACDTTMLSTERGRDRSIADSKCSEHRSICTIATAALVPSRRVSDWATGHTAEVWGRKKKQSTLRAEQTSVHSTCMQHQRSTNTHHQRKGRCGEREGGGGGAQQGRIHVHGTQHTVHTKPNNKTTLADNTERMGRQEQGKGNCVQRSNVQKK